MNILITGASGLIGSALQAYLRDKGHGVYCMARSRSSQPFWWQPETGEIHWDTTIPIDAVVCLNGVNIGDKPWNEKRKTEIIKSRVDSVGLMSKKLAELERPPAVFISGSAIGYYGDTGSDFRDEYSQQGRNYLTDVVTAWESAAQSAIDSGIRTVFIRSGVVLSPKGGALKKMLLPFSLGLGGKVGSGQQYMSWIHIEDEVRAIEFLISNTQISGPVNLTAPTPVTNQAFTSALGRALKRPTVFPMPSLVVKLIFGEMGELLLLGSNRIHCKVLQDNGFEFVHQTIDETFQSLLSKPG